MSCNFHFFLSTLLASVCLLAERGLAQNDPDVYCSAGPACNITRDIEVTNGSDVDFGDRVVNLSGILSVRDGSMTIRAAELRIVGQGQLNATRGNGGGAFTIITDGDIRIDGSRASGAVALNGPSGGNLTLQSSSGRIFGTGRIFASHRQGDPLGDGGLIDIITGGSVELTSPIEAVGGVEASGGELDIVAGGDVMMAGTLDFQGGGDGAGTISISSGGRVTILGEVLLDGQGEVGDAGSLEIDAESVSLNGRIRGRGSNDFEFCGDSADVTIDVTGTLDVLGEIDVSSRRDCLAGTIDFTAATVTLRSPLRIRAVGSEGQAGTVNVGVTERLDCLADLASVDGRGTDGGGTVLIEVDSLDATNETILDCDIDLTGPGADFEVTANTNVSIGGTIVVGQTGTAEGTFITVEGCTLRVDATASVTSRSSNGTNLFVAREQTTVAGSVRAGMRNEFRHRTGLDPVVTGSVVPAAVSVEDDELMGCGFTGGTPTFTRTATRTRTPTPTPTPPLACIGDCNENGIVTVDELVLGIDIGLGSAAAGACPALDRDGDGQVDISENITAVSNWLNDCAIVR